MWCFRIFRMKERVRNHHHLQGKISKSSWKGHEILKVCKKKHQMLKKVLVCKMVSKHSVPANAKVSMHGLSTKERERIACVPRHERHLNAALSWLSSRWWIKSVGRGKSFESCWSLWIFFYFRLAVYRLKEEYWSPLLSFFVFKWHLTSSFLPFIHRHLYVIWPAGELDWSILT